MKRVLFLLIASGILVYLLFNEGCSSTISTENKVYNLNAFWDQGMAEVSTYSLNQQRYGDMHKGEVVLVFVKEPFLKNQQVKDERQSGEPSEPVLKMNAIRRFTTGIYDYQLMTSAFTSAMGTEKSQTYKVTNSAQEWCGQTFLQLNHLPSKQMYKVQSNSYFEQEGDYKDRIKVDYLEDELFNLLKINPERLPVGEFKILPSAAHIRLMHIPIRSTEAIATLSSSGPESLHYKVEMPALNRVVNIEFDREPPHSIQGWTEVYPGLDGKIRKSSAKLKGRSVVPYWKYGKSEYKTLRKEIKLD